ncbi:MAG TPA: molybdate ABC transporter substrate-binding protein [Rhodospirillales bacterium]|nr:molybdate ABC transporter substrate-binding protein [Rhodospirillales bacterium]
MLALAAVIGPPGSARAADPDTVTVFAAASLTDALQALAADDRAAGGGEVRFSFAASSALARQIEAGAPADIFVSANPEWMDYLAGRGLIAAPTRVEPLGNALVLVAPGDSRLSTVRIDPGLDLAALIGPGARIATGDPAHVPVGVYAQKAFEHFGLWARVEPLLARTDSVRAALALVERGEAPLGIVYASDAKASSRVKVVGSFPPDSHPPVTYPFAIVAGRDTPAVRRFFARITGGAAAPVYERFGFIWRGPTG